jgi:hypothetical protein
VADGLTLLDEHRGMIYHLNQTGAVILAALLADGAEAAVAMLCARYTTTAYTAERDVVKLLDSLVAHRLVIRS